jgi:hypothetical protein
MISASLSERKWQEGIGLVSLMLMILALSFAAITVMSIVAPSLMNRQRFLTENKGRILRVAVNRYKADGNGALPGLPVLVQPPAACLPNAGSSPPVMNGQCGPYLTARYPYLDLPGVSSSLEGLRDGWGSMFDYDDASDVLKSCGPDRTCGSGGDDIEFP